MLQNILLSKAKDLRFASPFARSKSQVQRSKQKGKLKLRTLLGWVRLAQKRQFKTKEKGLRYLQFRNRFLKKEEKKLSSETLKTFRKKVSKKVSEKMDEEIQTKEIVVAQTSRSLLKRAKVQIQSAPDCRTKIVKTKGRGLLKRVRTQKIVITQKTALTTHID